MLRPEIAPPHADEYGRKDNPADGIAEKRELKWIEFATQHFYKYVD